MPPYVHFWFQLQLQAQCCTSKSNPCCTSGHVFLYFFAHSFLFHPPSYTIVFYRHTSVPHCTPVTPLLPLTPVMTPCLCCTSGSCSLPHLTTAPCQLAMRPQLAMQPCRNWNSSLLQSITCQIGQNTCCLNFNVESLTLDMNPSVTNMIRKIATHCSEQGYAISRSTVVFLKSRLGQVYNGHLYIRYRRGSQKNKAESSKNLQTTSLFHSNAKTTLTVLLTFNKVEKTKVENFDFVFFFLLLFFLARHNYSIRSLQIIMKYGSTSYLRIRQVLKWPPIHKV